MQSRGATLGPVRGEKLVATGGRERLGEEACHRRSASTLAPGGLSGSGRVFRRVGLTLAAVFSLAAPLAGAGCRSPAPPPQAQSVAAPAPAAAPAAAPAKPDYVATATADGHLATGVHGAVTSLPVSR